MIKTKATVGKPEMKHDKTKETIFFSAFSWSCKDVWQYSTTTTTTNLERESAFKVALVALKLVSGHFQNSTNLLLVLLFFHFFLGLL